jgi:hypothetical protein
MTRAALIAYGVLIDKAQLLSGGATARGDRRPIDARNEAEEISTI